MNFLMKLYNDNCLNVLKELPDNSVDLIITDPPYSICSVDINKKRNKDNLIDERYSRHIDNGLDKISNGYDISIYNSEFIRVLNKCSIYIWMSLAQLQEYLNFYVNERNWNFTFLYWIKTNVMPAYQNKYLNDIELCVWFHKDLEAWVPYSYNDARTWYMSDTIQFKKYKHPTVKPLEFILRMIRNSSKKGEVILDPFMGSGTTGVACSLTEREFIGIESDKDYFENAEKRINDTIRKNKQRLF